MAPRETNLVPRALFPVEEKLKTMLIQNSVGETKKEHYGMLCYFLEWSIGLLSSRKEN